MNVEKYYFVNTIHLNVNVNTIHSNRMFCMCDKTCEIAVVVRSFVCYAWRKWPSTPLKAGTHVGQKCVWTLHRPGVLNSTHFQQTFSEIKHGCGMKKKSIWTLNEQ